MPARLPLLVCCILLPASGGFFLARLTGSPVSGAENSSTVPVPGPSLERTAEPESPPEPLPGSTPARARELLKLLAANNPAGAQKFVQDSLQRQELLQSFFEQSPQAALRFLEAFPDRQNVGLRAEEMFTGLPPKDLPVVLAWMQRQEDPAFRRMLLSSLMPKWLREDQAAATAYMQKLTEPEDRAQTRGMLMNHMLSPSQPVSAQLEFIRSLPPEEQAELWGSRDAMSLYPEEVLPALDRLPDSPERTSALAAAFTGWGASDPLRAAKAAGELTDPALQGTAFFTIAKSWSGRDSYRASQWADSLPAGAQRDAAAAGLASELTLQQPDAAFSWARSISQPEPRREFMESVYREWSKADPASAASALETANLTAEERQQLTASPLPSSK